MTSIGTKFSSPGIDVFTASDKDLTYSSKYKTLKIIKKGMGDGNDIPHGLDYPPAFYCFTKGTASWQKNNPGGDYNNTYPNAFFPSGNNFNTWASSLDTPFSDSINLSQVSNGSTYYILTDPASSPTNTPNKGLGSFGMKMVSGSDVLNTPEFDLGFSSRYRTLRYIPNKSSEVTLTLPKLFGSAVTDSSPEESVYVDIEHGLGFPPFYLGFYTSDTFNVGRAREAIDFDGQIGGSPPFVTFTPTRIISSWCDATRIRFTFFRKALYPDVSWPDETITIKYIIFNEDLTDFS